MKMYNPRSKTSRGITYSISGKHLSSSQRINIVFFVVITLFFIITMRLFFLQVIEYDYYNKLSNHARKIVLPAKRGQILGEDYFSQKSYVFATNATYDLFYVDPDPQFLKNKPLASKQVSPYVWDMLCDDVNNTDLEIQLQKRRLCIYHLFRYARLSDKERTDTMLYIEKLWDEKKYKDILESSILERMRHEKVTYSQLLKNPSEEVQESIKNLALQGIYVESHQIYANPTEISNPSDYTKKLLPFLIDKDKSTLKYLLTNRDLHYAPIAHRIPSSFSERLKKLKEQNDDYKGFVLVPETWREYPENTLASHIIGYVNADFIPQYGIEEYFNEEMRGKDGEIIAQTDVAAVQVSFRDSEITSAINGQDIVLTLDRIIQKKTEELLKETVEKYEARSGQVIIIEPNTGQILAMANYPSFDPNFFTQALQTHIVEDHPETRGNILETYTEIEKYTENILNEETGEIIEVEQEREKETYKIYQNFIGPESYLNKNIASIYEPGSVIKALTVAAAIDTGEVTPMTRSDYIGPLEIDEFISDRDKKIVIHNDNDSYYGRETITEILENSSNVGTAFIADKLGKSLLYNFLEKFGFNKKTGIQLPGEISGFLPYWKTWGRTQLITSAFGQGMSATPLQVVMSYGALANGGKLMKPYIIKKMINTVTGETSLRHPEVIRRVIKPETAQVVSSMLTSTVKHGSARRGGVDGYNVAGKTGTSQIPRSDGPGYDDGIGSTVASFIGYAPSDQPKFVMLVKVDRPRRSAYGSRVAGPLFSGIASFILEYYGVPKK
jgi:cell division protein FtsI/penicillin-binding protein 2